jgi:hypothetical protein
MDLPIPRTAAIKMPLSVLILPLLPAVGLPSDLPPSLA